MQRHALAILFAVLALALAAVAAAALATGSGAARWLVGGAALALAGWLASLSFSLLRRRRT